jgi:hypothetical protein
VSNRKKTAVFPVFTDLAARAGKNVLCISAEVDYGPFFMYCQQPPASTRQLLCRCFSSGEARARAGLDLAATANLNCVLYPSYRGTNLCKSKLSPRLIFSYSRQYGAFPIFSSTTAPVEI